MTLADRLREVPAATGPGGDLDETGEIAELGWKNGDDIQVLRVPSEGLSDLLQVVLHLAVRSAANRGIHPRDVVAEKKVPRPHGATGIAHLGQHEGKEVLGVVVGNAYTQLALTQDQTRRLADALAAALNNAGETG